MKSQMTLWNSMSEREAGLATAAEAGGWIEKM